MNNQYDAHAGQIADTDNSLHFDNIVIQGEISKDDKFFVAKSAVEFEYDDDEGDKDTPVEVKDVIDDWARPVVRSGCAKTIDGMITVYCADEVFRPILWLNDGKAKCMMVGKE